MLCQRCGEREAVVQVVVANPPDKQVQMWLCEKCAKALAPHKMKTTDLSDIKDFIEGLFQPFEGIENIGIPESIYTDEASKVVEAAKKNAHSRQYKTIGTEHLLWAILNNQDCAAAKILVENNVTLAALKMELESWMNFGTEVVKPTGFSRRAQEVIEHAKKHAKFERMCKVGTEHILLGLIREEEGVAARVLTRFQITEERIMNVLNHLHFDGENLPEGNILQEDADKLELQETQAKALKLLEGFGRNLNEYALAGKIDPVVGRDAEIEHLMQVLCRRSKNNPVLIGEAGVGKTAVAEGLAQKIAEKEVPSFLQDKIIFSLELGYVVAGAKYRGELEERLCDIIDAVKDSKDIILFIDELQMIMNATEGMMSIANILKPALARGELHVIGATTTEDYRRSIEKDAAMERRFHPIMIKAPTDKETLIILEKLRSRFEDFHNVKIADDTLAAAIKLSDRYLNDRNLPDKAIDLLDEACSAVKMKNADTNDKAEVTVPMIEKIISQWTDIPLERLTSIESANLLKLESTLHNRIVGQTGAVEVVAKAIRRARVGLKDKNRPVGSFLFLGPTGVGKTELAKAIAENLFGDERSIIRFDMSEFMEKHTVSRLIGAPPGYVGYEEGGKLTSAVKRRPYAVVLLDEIEKAHADVFNILLQIMEDGRLTDGQGKTVDFRNVVLIMTSNAGVEKFASGGALGFKNSDAAYLQSNKEKVLEEIKKVFRPEFLNRLDESIVFDTLSKKELAEIVDKLLGELEERLADTGLKLEASMKARAKLLEVGMDPTYGARPLRRALRKHVEDIIADKYLDGTFAKGDLMILDVDDNNEFVIAKKINENILVHVDVRGEVVDG